MLAGRTPENANLGVAVGSFASVQTHFAVAHATGNLGRAGLEQTL